MKRLVLAIDLGSSSVRAALFDERGRRHVSSTASRPYSICHTADGGAELDPLTLLNATRRCVRETLRHARSAEIMAVSGSAFWHSLLGLGRNGRPLTPIYMWAEARSASDAAELREEFSERRIQLRTGCMLRAPFWPAKLRWLKRTQPILFRRVQQWVSPAWWIFQQLFGVAGTSHSMASGTGLYHRTKQAWDEELCLACDTRIEQLDTIDDCAVAGKLLPGVPLFAAIGDGAAGNLGCGADHAGSVAINIGTSAAVRAILPQRGLTPKQLPAGHFCYAVDDDRVVIGGAISNAGNLHRWCLRELRVGADAEAALRREWAAEDRLTVLPFWIEERAPTWPVDLRGTITGLTPASSAADILRATTTSVYYRLAAILDQLEAATGSARENIVSGGILNSTASLALLADCIGRDLRIAAELESSLRGAAVYALEKLGLSAQPLRRGKLVRHRPALTAKHRLRRAEQEALERRLAGSSTPLPSRRRSRPGG